MKCVSPSKLERVNSRKQRAMLLVKCRMQETREKQKNRTDLDDVVVSSRLMRLVILGVLEQYFVHVGGGVLEQFVRAAEDDERNLAVAQHGQLVRLLHQTELALRERHLFRAGSRQCK